MKPDRINNTDAHRYVTSRVEFVGSNLFAEDVRKDEQAVMYVVYSYGYHFPMYAFDYTINEWLGNQDKYSPTTSRHQSRTRPNRVDQWYDTSTLIQIVAAGGTVNYIASKLKKAA